MAKRRQNDGDSKKYFDWLEFASEDFAAADSLRALPHCANAAAFHCQQCAEKALKGFLLFHQVQHFDGHSLVWLCKQAARFDPAFKACINACAALNPYYIEARYPTDEPDELSAKQLQLLFAHVREVYDLVCGKIYGWLLREEDAAPE